MPVALDGVHLPDSRDGRVVDLGAERGPTVLVLIRHRF